MKKWVVFLIAVTSAVLLSGCAALGKQKKLEVQKLKNQINLLEAQLESRDEEIASLRQALAETRQEQEESAKLKIVDEVKSRPSAKQIQIALKNAGYNPGPIDGKKGKQTREAIRAFQRDNNLAVDGKPGKETWGLLSRYLYEKAK